MNTNAQGNNRTPEPQGAELLALDAALSRVGAADRAGATPGLEDRLFAATRTAIAPLARDVAATGAQVDQLAAADAAAGAAGLEAKAFELSREAVASGRYTDPVAPSLRLAGEGERPARVVVRTRSIGWVVRLAAAIAVAGAAVAVWRLGNTSPTVEPNATIAMNSTSDQLAQNISDEMDVLFEVMGTGHSEASAGTLDENDHDTSWVDDLFTKESL
jgi:hypothetical protein